MHCIIVLVGLFVTTCYWDTVPVTDIDASVWKELNYTLVNTTDTSLLPSPSDTNKLVDVSERQSILSRCWCDFSRTSFFEPFNVQSWDADSVLAHPPKTIPNPSPPPSDPSKEAGSEETEQGRSTASAGGTAYYLVDKFASWSLLPSSWFSKPSPAVAPAPASVRVNSEKNKAKEGPSVTEPATEATTTHKSRGRSPPRSLAQRAWDSSSSKSTSNPDGTPQSWIYELPIIRWSRMVKGSTNGGQDTGSGPWRPHPRLPLLRKKYDLRRHGIGLVLDFGWERNEEGAA